MQESIADTILVITSIIMTIVSSGATSSFSKTCVSRNSQRQQNAEEPHPGYSSEL